MISWLSKLLRRDGQGNKLMTLGELAKITGVNYHTLRKAVQEGRVDAIKSGYYWLSTPRDVNRAIGMGNISRPAKD